AAFPVTGPAMQDEPSFALDRAAIEYHAGAYARGNIQARGGLFQHVTQIQTAGAIDDQPHGAIGVVLAQIDQGLRETRILHVRHGDQEMVLEVARKCLGHAAKYWVRARGGQEQAGSETSNTISGFEAPGT